jgi:LmbE family N-acetylglucosaminyl deacetylase
VANKPRILVIGAHPDDCEIKAGGTAVLWKELGFTVRFVSATNGCSGHQSMTSAELATRRKIEAANAAKVIGIESLVMDFTDGSLEPTLANRRVMIGMIRAFKPDLILTHRPNDYHPDHRYTSQLVQDSAFSVTVPKIVPEVPALRENPVVAYLSDLFQKPLPLQPDIVVGIDSVLEKKADMMHAHVSQFYEWLPWLEKKEAELPAGDRARREWLKKQRNPYDANCANRYRETLNALYGRKAGSKFKYAEAFEVCEYGGRMTPEKMKLLFPFLKS